MTSTPRSSGAARHSRIARLAASVALGAAAVLGTTACGLVAEMGTTDPYSPSDGINVRNSGPISVLNAMFVVAAEDEGQVANFVGAVVNTTRDDETLTMQIGEGAEAITETVSVEANGVISFGAEGEDPLRIPDFAGVPGETVPVFFQSGDAEGTIGNVPVLDGQQNYLSTLVPTPEPTSR